MEAAKLARTYPLNYCFTKTMQMRAIHEGCDGVLARLIRPTETPTLEMVSPNSLLVGFISKQTTRGIIQYNVCYISWHRDEKATATVEAYIIIIANPNSLSSAFMEQEANYIKAF